MTATAYSSCHACCTTLDDNVMTVYYSYEYINGYYIFVQSGTYNNHCNGVALEGRYLTPKKVIGPFSFCLDGVLYSG